MDELQHKKASRSHLTCLIRKVETILETCCDANATMSSLIEQKAEWEQYFDSWISRLSDCCNYSSWNELEAKAEATQEYILDNISQ